MTHRPDRTAAVPAERPLPAVIQGGMGVAVSSWELARAVSRAGQLGVVSGTALDVVCARRLQQGDPGGHVRRALASFPDPAMARRVMRAHYVHGGLAADAPFAAVPRFTIEPSPALQELVVVAAFCEVWLAREGHDGAVGINLLRKIEMPLPWVLLGAMLAGIDYVLVGAGNPADIPGLLRSLARGDDAALGLRVQGLRSDAEPVAVRCRPRQLLGAAMPDRLPEPRFLAIVASTDLAEGLAADPSTRPFGFVVEGPLAGGHNAPPRGPRRTDELGQPIYDARDEPDLARIAGLGLPFWLAGGWAGPGAVHRARALGAVGVQVGTAFAYCAESGLAEPLKDRTIAAALEGSLAVRSDWRISPTGFPFRVVELPGTLSDADVVARRRPVCDLGALRSPYVRPDGDIDYRCPAEPLAMYVRKGGRAQNAEGRACLCNGLMASAGLAQRRPDGTREAPLVTSGADFDLVRELAASAPDGHYRAADVLERLLDVGAGSAALKTRAG